MENWTKLVELPAVVVSTWRQGDAWLFVTQAMSGGYATKHWEVSKLDGGEIVVIHRSAKELGRVRANGKIEFLEVTSTSGERSESRKQLMEMQEGKARSIVSMPLDTVGYHRNEISPIRWNTLFAYFGLEEGEQKVHANPDRTLRGRIRLANSEGTLAFVDGKQVFFYDSVGTIIGVVKTHGQVVALEPSLSGPDFFAVVARDDHFYLISINHQNATPLTTFGTLSAEKWPVVTILVCNERITVVLRQRKPVIKEYLFLTLRRGIVSSDTISGFKNFSAFAPGVVGRLDVLRGVSEIWSVSE